jgi:hypothetical protein
MQALSQLSYGPLVVSKCSREIEIVGPVDSSSLVVQAWADAQCDRRALCHPRNRDQEASIEVKAVSGDRIDLLRGVAPANESVSCPPRRLAGHDDCLPTTGRPFALNAQEPPSQIENKVVSTALGMGL